MSKYKRIFPKRNTLLLVIHAENREQALRNAQIAVDEGADGVFLINHRISVEKLISCYYGVRSKIPNLWIGLNCLKSTRTEALIALPAGTDGLWTDEVGLDINSHDPVAETRAFSKLRKFRGGHELHFGGVAFKYQPVVATPVHEAELTMPFVDVITTSGNKTGEPASIDKIKSIKEAIGDHPLATASGTTAENVEEYLPYVNCFLVATGVSKSENEFDHLLVRRFVRRINQ